MKAKERAGGFAERVGLVLDLTGNLSGGIFGNGLDDVLFSKTLLLLLSDVEVVVVMVVEREGEMKGEEVEERGVGEGDFC